MTEEALQPAGEPAEEDSAPTRPRTRRRRRRRGGRGRSGAQRSTTTSESARPSPSTEDTAPPEAEAAGGSTSETSTEEKASPSQTGDRKSTATRRRRRRRRKPSASSARQQTAKTDASQQAPEEPPPSAPRGRPAAEAAPSGDGSPTRTSRAARTSARDRRRRQPVVHAARRVDKTMLITEHHDRLQIAVVEGRDLVEHYVARTGARSMVGNVYLGKVQTVLPGMEAAFVDIGRGRNAVLYSGEVSYDEDVQADRRRIETVLKPGQKVMVQVSKDPMRGKGARLTAQISLPGRFLVYVPDGAASGISRRLPDRERERLRRIIRRIRPEDGGLIVRTAAEGAAEEDLRLDLERLQSAWEEIAKASKRARAPKLLYQEPELVERVVRDVFSPAEFEHIVTDSREVFDRVATYLSSVAPELEGRLQYHDGPLPLFEAQHISEQIHKALERKVWLPSGGYVVIDRVEAMTVIDVNTGKHVGKSNLEETVVQTNLEAAKEIARQLRLRDIGGIIVIDFIDMLLQTNRELVIGALHEELAHDKTRSQVFEITPLGLLEMTRKKVSAGLLESFSETCPTCEGRGILVTHEI